MLKGGTTYRIISDPLGSGRLVVDAEAALDELIESFAKECKCEEEAGGVRP